MTLVFNRDFEARYGEPVTVADRVRRLTARNPGPFTFLGTNTFLVGENALAVIDPGPADAAHIAALLRAIGSAELRHILVSHAHRDHAAGARLLQAQTGAPILAARGPDAKAKIGIAGLLDASTEHGFRPDITLIDGMIVDGPDYRLEAVGTPGHAPDHLAFALVGEDIVFSGDHVMGWATTAIAPPEGSMGDYLASLDKLLARPEDLYLPGHGPPVGHAHAHVRALRAHRKAREASILARLAAGDRTIAEIVGRIYADLDPRLVGGAALSTLAHLQDLVNRGLVECDRPPEVTSRYRPTAASG
jgi:glyoxylase-like metal-dependent hydrolase (beta-lactamase superfamily II)